MTATPTCFVFANHVCVAWDATFGFWEFLATATATGLVTWLTIYWSVRSARDATERTLRAAEEEAEQGRLERQATREAERVDRLKAAAEEGIRRSREIRSTFAEAVIRLIHLLKLTDSIEPGEPLRMSAEADWAALKVQLSGSDERYSGDLYEFVDLVRTRQTANRTVVKKMDYKDDMIFLDSEHIDYGSQLIADVATGWVAQPELPRASWYLPTLRAWRDKYYTAMSEHIRELLEQGESGRTDAESAQ